MEDNPQSDDFDFPGQHWKAFAPEKAKDLGVHPNQLWFNEKSKAGALIVMKPQAYDEFAVGKAGLDYVASAHAAQRIKGHVVLATRQHGKLAVVAHKCVADVAALLERVPPREGQWGPYWWVKNDLTPDAPTLGEDEVPF